MKYEILKEVCKKMFSLIGSGKYITAPIVSETGEPSNDPILLEQIYGNVHILSVPFMHIAPSL